MKGMYDKYILKTKLNDNNTIRKTNLMSDNAKKIAPLSKQFNLIVLNLEI